MISEPTIKADKDRIDEHYIFILGLLRSDRFKFNCMTKSDESDIPKLPQN